MDPSKRICLKHLPDNATKREIAELVRNRTGAQPHSIDLGLDSEGHVRHYAHFSCEGAKNVLEVLQSGVVMRDQTVYGFPAKPHYSFALAEARRKREREEAAAAEQQAAELEEVKRRAMEKTNGGELRTSKVPKKTAFSVKPKYGIIASQLAMKYREAHRQRNGKTTPYGHSGTSAAAAQPSSVTGPAAVPGGGAAVAGNKKQVSEPHQRSHHAKIAPVQAKRGKGSRGDKGGNHTDSKPAAAVAAQPPPPPPQPSKEEKKLSGLQARLAALKEKLKKS